MAWIAFPLSLIVVCLWAAIHWALKLPSYRDFLVGLTVPILILIIDVFVFIGVGTPLAQAPVMARNLGAMMCGMLIVATLTALGYRLYDRGYGARVMIPCGLFGVLCGPFAVNILKALWQIP